jgi:hypothetical protein
MSCRHANDKIRRCIMFIDVDSWLYYFLRTHPGKSFLGCFIGFVLWCFFYSWVTSASPSHVLYIIASSFFYFLHWLIFGFRKKDFFVISLIITFLFFVPIISVVTSYIIGFLGNDALSQLVFRSRFLLVPIVFVAIIVMTYIIGLGSEIIEKHKKYKQNNCN